MPEYQQLSKDHNIPRHQQTHLKKIPTNGHATHSMLNCPKPAFPKECPSDPSRRRISYTPSCIGQLTNIHIHTQEGGVCIMQDRLLSCTNVGLTKTLKVTEPRFYGRAVKSSTETKLSQLIPVQSRLLTRALTSHNPVPITPAVMQRNWLQRVKVSNSIVPEHWFETLEQGIQACWESRRAVN